MPPSLRHAGRLGVSYRPMTEADLPFIAELYASTRREEVAATGWPQPMQEAFLHQQHEAQHSHYSQHYAAAEWLVIEIADQPVGRLYLWQDGADFHIVDISLLPSSRGSGVGGAVLRDVLELAAEAGRGVSIHVEKHNPARNLYSRLGFEMIEDKGVYDLMRATPSADSIPLS